MTELTLIETPYARMDLACKFYIEHNLLNHKLTIKKQGDNAHHGFVPMS